MAHELVVFSWVAVMDCRHHPRLSSDLFYQSLSLNATGSEPLRRICRIFCGDTGGDHGLHDYCLDDPVSMKDPTGLFPPALLLLAGIGSSLGLGLGGSYGAAAIVDSITKAHDGQESTAARDAIKSVAPRVAQIHNAAFFPGKVATGYASTGIWRVLAGISLMELLMKGSGDSTK